LPKADRQALLVRRNITVGFGKWRKKESANRGVRLEKKARKGSKTRGEKRTDPQWPPQVRGKWVSG